MCGWVWLGVIVPTWMLCEDKLQEADKSIPLFDVNTSYKSKIYFSSFQGIQKDIVCMTAPPPLQWYLGSCARQSLAMTLKMPLEQVPPSLQIWPIEAFWQEGKDWFSPGCAKQKAIISRKQCPQNRLIFIRPQKGGDLKSCRGLRHKGV